MTKEHYSPGSASPPFMGFHQVAGDPIPTTDAGNNCCETMRGPTAHELLSDLIARCHLTHLQIQTFRDSLPERLDGVARQGLICLAQSTLEEIENDLDRLQLLKSCLIDLRNALPKHLNGNATQGLRTLIDTYKFYLSRNWAFPN